MIHPYGVLGLPRNASEEEIRKRYLELVRAHPPSRAPRRFQKVVAAYDAIKTPAARVESHLFGAVRYETFEDALADVEDTADLGRRVPGLRELVEAEAPDHGKPRKRLERRNPA